MRVAFLSMVLIFSSFRLPVSTTSMPTSLAKSPFSMSLAWENAFWMSSFAPSVA